MSLIFVGKTLPYDLQRHAVYSLPSGHYVLLGNLEPQGISAFLVNAKVMEYVKGGGMYLPAKWLYSHARLCWSAADWQRRVTDVADDLVAEVARRERIDLAHEMDALRAKAIDAEHKAQKDANRRLLKLAA
ncbi:MAG: hypothetical protein V4706_02680 [Pseudomonadota bacterium]